LLRIFVGLSTVVWLAAGHVTALPLRNGDVLVADQTAGTIRYYSASGADLGVFVSGLTSPTWLAADAKGNIYVSGYTGDTVKKYSPSGDLLLNIPTPFTPVRAGESSYPRGEKPTD